MKLIGKYSKLIIICAIINFILTPISIYCSGYLKSDILIMISILIVPLLNNLIYVILLCCVFFYNATAPKHRVIRNPDDILVVGKILESNLLYIYESDDHSVYHDEEGYYIERDGNREYIYGEGPIGSFKVDVEITIGNIIEYHSYTNRRGGIPGKTIEIYITKKELVNRKYIQYLIREFNLS